MAITTTASLLPFLRYLPVDAIGHDRTYRMVRTVVPERWLRTIYGVTDATRLAATVPSDLGRLGDAVSGTLDAATGTASRLAVGGRGHGSDAGTAIETDISPDDRRLIAAHRVMQITADRAGLVDEVVDGVLLRLVHRLCAADGDLRGAYLAGTHHSPDGRGRGGDGAPGDLRVVLVALLPERLDHLGLLSDADARGAPTVR